MIRAILLSGALLTSSAALAPSAEAGDLRFIFGLGDRHGNSVRVKIGSRDHNHRSRSHSSHRRSRRHARTERVIRHRHHDHHRRHHVPTYRTITERVWVAGHFDRVAYTVRLPETHQRVKVAARYEWRRDSCGRRYRVCVRRSYYKTVCTPGRVETRHRQVFRKGRYENRTKRQRI